MGGVLVYERGPVCGLGMLSVRPLFPNREERALLDGSSSGFDAQVTVRWECAQAARV